VPTNVPAGRTPALDFLAECEGLAETVGYVDFLSPRDLARIGEIIRNQDEGRARSELLHLHGNLINRAYLDDGMMARLESIVDNDPTRARDRGRQSAGSRRPRTAVGWLMASRLRVLAALAVLGLLLGLVFGVIVPWVHDNGLGSTPPAGAAPQNPPAANVPPPAYSDLQLFKQDWGPWNQVTPSDAAPATGSPAVLLLQSGAYYVSETWTISASNPGWTEDTVGGDVGTVNVHGDYADITDANGVPYIVGINQPFVESTNPLVILRIDPTGTVYRISTAHGESPTVRHHL
jgi:hypothetical protein